MNNYRNSGETGSWLPSGKRLHHPFFVAKSTISMAIFYVANCKRWPTWWISRPRKKIRKTSHPAPLLWTVAGGLSLPRTMVLHLLCANRDACRRETASESMFVGGVLFLGPAGRGLTLGDWTKERMVIFWENIAWEYKKMIFTTNGSTRMDELYRNYSNGSWTIMNQWE